MNALTKTRNRRNREWCQSTGPTAQATQARTTQLGGKRGSSEQSSQWCSQRAPAIGTLWSEAWSTPARRRQDPRRRPHSPDHRDPSAVKRLHTWRKGGTRGGAVSGERGGGWSCVCGWRRGMGGGGDTGGWRGGGMRTSAVCCGWRSVSAKGHALTCIRRGDLDGREQRAIRKGKK